MLCPPPKKNWGEAALFVSPGLKAAASALLAAMGGCGEEGPGPEAARLALPFTQPGGSHGRSHWRFPCQSHAAAFSRPLGAPPLLTDSSQDV